MAASEHLNKILFHASTSPVPPHKGNSKKNGNTFHLGTPQSAIDRISFVNFSDDDFAEMNDDNVPEIKAYMHVYEAQVPKNIPIQHDPHGSGYSDWVSPNWDQDKAIDDQKVKDIGAYENLHEDPGSVSYVMHKNMLRNNKATFVGTMPFVARAEVNDDTRILKELGYD